MTDGKLLLLVEDEPLILLAVQDVLEAEGYAVVTADNGSDATAAIDVLAERTSGLITDIRLGPGPDGWEVARRARTRRPELPIVYITGDSAHEWPAKGVPRSVVVQKPFGPDQVVRVVAELIPAAAA